MMSADDAERSKAQSEPAVADLVRTLRRDGVLTRHQLFERSGARNWVRERFETALQRGIADGSIKHLGADLFEVGENAPDLNESRFDPT